LPGRRGEAASRAAENAFTRAGSGADEAANRYGARQEGHFARVEREIQRASGANGRNAIRRMAEMRDDTRDIFNPQYDTLRQQPVSIARANSRAGQEVERLRQSPRFAEIETAARRDLAELEAQGLAQNTGATDPNVFGFDLVNMIQQRLRTRAEYTNGMSPEQRDAMMVFGRLREQFNDVFDRAYPDFARVRADYAARRNVMEAANSADNVIFGSGKGRAAEAAEAAMERLRNGTATTDEILALRELGGVEMARRAARRQGDGADRAKQFLTPDVEAKIREIYGRIKPSDSQNALPDTAETLIRRLRNESQRIERVRKMTGGSPTAKRLAGMADDEAAAGIAGSAATGYLPGVWQGMANWVSRNLSRKNADAVADLFSRLDPQEVIRILEAVGRLQAPMRRSDAVIGQTAAAGSTALAKALARRSGEEASGAGYE